MFALGLLTGVILTAGIIYLYTKFIEKEQD